MKVETIEEAATVSMRQLVQFGNPMVTLSLQDSAFIVPMKSEIINRSAVFRALGFFRAHGEEAGWENVSRARFMRPAHIRGMSVGQKAGVGLLASRLWLPQTHKRSKKLGQAFQLANTESGANLKSLKNFMPNRIGVNRMQGTPESPAIIMPHVDVPEELGAVVVFELFREGQAEAAYLAEKNMTVIFSKNTCDETGVDRPIHSIDTELFRVSATFAELTART
jgi:hypothetical protein